MFSSCDSTSMLVIARSVRVSGVVALERSVSIRKTRSSRPLLVRVVDQRDFVVRIGRELVVVVPRRHEELDVVGIEREPIGPALLVERARLLDTGTPEWRRRTASCASVRAVLGDDSAASSSSRASTCAAPMYRPSSSVLMPLSSGFRPIRSALSSGP